MASLLLLWLLLLWLRLAHVGCHVLLASSHWLPLCMNWQARLPLWGPAMPLLLL